MSEWLQWVGLVILLGPMLLFTYAIMWILARDIWRDFKDE